MNVLHRISSLCGSGIHHMHQHLGSFHMTQKIMTQTHPLGGSFNQSRNIRHDKASSRQIHHPQMGIQRGKMVIGHLWPGIADPGKQSGFPHIGKAHQPHIRQHLQLQLYKKLLARFSRSGKFRHLHGGGGKVHISKPSFASPKYDLPFIASGHVCNNLAAFKILNHGSLGNFNDQVLGIRSMTFSFASRLSVPCNIFFHLTKIRQGIQSFIHLEDDITSPASIASVRTSRRHIQLSAKAHMAVSALSGFYKYFCTVCKHSFPF